MPSAKTRARDSRQYPTSTKFRLSMAKVSAYKYHPQQLQKLYLNILIVNFVRLLEFLCYFCSISWFQFRTRVKLVQILCEWEKYSFVNQFMASSLSRSKTKEMCSNQSQVIRMLGQGSHFKVAVLHGPRSHKICHPLVLFISKLMKGETAAILDDNTKLFVDVIQYGGCHVTCKARTLTSRSIYYLTSRCLYSTL